MPARATRSDAVPRHVLMSTDTVGGVWTYALQLARALAPHGVRVTLAALGAPLSAAQWAEARAVPHLAVEEGPFALEWMDAPWEDVEASGRWLLALERRLAPDAVHLNGYAHGALPWRRPPLVVAHSCVLSWFEAVKGERAPARYARYRAEVARGLAGAGRVVAVSAAMLEALARHYGPLPPGARVIPNARSPGDFPPAAKEPFVLAAGRLWDEAKGLAALDAAAAGLAWPVQVAGEERHPCGGPDAQAAHVQALGRLPPAQLAALMGRAAVYALPARYEPFGLSALEAALAGCALVLGDIPSLREVWGEAARYVPPGDARALRAALEDLLARPAERERLARAARARALRYGPEPQAQAYLAAYAGLSRAPALPRPAVPAA